MRELIIDSFAGGGGASTGIEQALGRPVDIAINHNAEALAMHQANHPGTRHLCEDIWAVDPKVATGGRPVALLWASPDCKHFSKAKGGKPVDKNIRGLAWVVIRWAAAVRPRVIMLENVEEFKTWGPVVNSQPCPMNKGHTFRRWIQRLQELGYRVEHRELRACDYGAPTIRKRLYLIARCDGLPIVWPAPTHGKHLIPYRTAADCIDWSIPCPSIFERKRPLADATLRRIAKGIQRYVIEACAPFIVTNTTGHPGALVSPTLIQVGYGEREGQSPRVPGLHKPLGTVVNGQKHALVTAFLAKHYTGVVGSDLFDPVGTVTAVDHHSLVSANLIHMGHGEQSADGARRWSHGIRDVADPLNTITASGATAGLVTSHIIKLRGDNVGSAASEPLHTISAGGQHHGEVRAFLIKYYGNERDGVSLNHPMHTVTAKDRIGLVTIEGQDYQIADIGLRMLTPRELFKAQGFPDSYLIDLDYNGKPLTKTAQVRLCGNSVCPPVAQALVEANMQAVQQERVA